jgi:hypothetical protein
MTAASTPAPPTLDPLHLSELERIERRLEGCLRDLRAYRASQQRGLTDQGVLGTRGLTQFLIDLLRAIPRTGLLPAQLGLTVTAMLLAAEHAGYAIPTARTMSKRLTERRYRVGDIDWQGPGQDFTNGSKGYWYWKGTTGEASR